jgi:hypothetical protein
MRVFLSWSGERSKQVAYALRRWIPKVLPGVVPWMSGRDIGAGTRWSVEIDKGLQTAGFGVICLTPENLGSPWVLFEAGVLARSLRVGRALCPYLIGVDVSRIQHGPLGQFQSVTADREGTWRLMVALNKARPPKERLRESLRARFGAKWPELAAVLAPPPSARAGHTPPVSTRGDQFGPLMARKKPSSRTARAARPKRAPARKRTPRH